MAMSYIKLKCSFWYNKKAKRLEIRYPTRYDAIQNCLFRLWTYCMLDKHDGFLGNDVEDIEIMANWKGEPGEFVKILTTNKTNFIDKTPEGYVLHDWYEHNESLNPDKKENDSKQMTKNAHKRYIKGEQDLLESNNITLKSCKWFDVDKDTGRLIVISAELPSYMQIGGEIFNKAGQFKNSNLFPNKKVTKQRLNLIKQHTKRCKNCGDPHINESFDECNICQSK